MPPDHFDIVVVGGGIHGVGVAQAAAAAGYRTVVLEQTALAAGTSSRSSKLIHGGLRYLESGQLKLVRESLRERDLLLKLAPGVVHAVPFFIPVYRDARRHPLTIRLGLTLYALLDGLRPLTRFRKVPRNEWKNLEGLATDKLRAVYQYWDAQTDDRALTEHVMRSAQVLGATLLCPAQVTTILRDDHGYMVRYTHENETREITGKFVINAAGPWANRLLQHVEPVPTMQQVDLVQGTHIVVDGTMHDKVFYLEAPRDGRAVFVMPWQGDKTLIGTTEHHYDGDPADVKPLPEEIDYLLDTLHHYFPDHGDKVSDSFAGLRVLPRTEHTHFYRSRETILHIDPEHPRLLTIYGGKLTGYRSTAEKVLDFVRPSLGTRRQRVRTNEIYLTRHDG